MRYAVPRRVVHGANFAPLDNARNIGNVHTIARQTERDYNSIKILGPPSGFDPVTLLETLEAFQSERPRRAVG